MPLKLRSFFTLTCLVLSVFTPGAVAQTGSVDADNWDVLRGERNIFALKEALQTDLPVSHGVHALGVAYVSAFSRDFKLADQALNYARQYAAAREDAAFAREVEEVTDILMREQGRFQALAFRLAHGPEAGLTWHRMVEYRANTLTSSYIGSSEFTLKNISPDKTRIVVPAQLGGVAGTLLFDTGADKNLLSERFATDYGAHRSEIRFNMSTADGTRSTELAELNSVELGSARFGGVLFGVQAKQDGVIGFFLNKGATGILGFPLASRFGEITFSVLDDRVEEVTLNRPTGVTPQSAGAPNMMIREDKPYIRVTLEDEVYACIFDTGAPRSVFSNNIITRHKKGLKLKTLSRRVASREGLRGKYIQTVPLHAGHSDLALTNVQVVGAGGPASDFCVIGLDAVIANGGARMNFETLQVQFGGSNAGRSQAFNLR